MKELSKKYFHHDSPPLSEIYKLGRHTLMRGDATSVYDIDLLMHGAVAPLCLTDPPYGIRVQDRSGAIGGGGANYKIIKGDEGSFTARAAYQLIQKVSEDQIIFGGNYFTEFLPPSKAWYIWEKGVPDGLRFSKAEMIWTSFMDLTRLIKWTWSGNTREGVRKDELTKKAHPNQKPVGLLAKLIEKHTKEGDIILDPFGGGGSTLIACEKTGRTCYMMELLPEYIDVIIKRYDDYVNKN
jgi:site-specific DNA-methyltransferase (adenine-specific)